MSDENRALSQRFFTELWNDKNVAVVDQILSDDHRRHDPAYPPNLPPGKEGFKMFVGGVFAGIPDVHFTTNDVLVDGDRVVTRWTVVGTQTGDFMGVPPSGNRVEVQGIDIARVENGKIAEIWASWDAFGLMRQIGAIPG